MLDDVKQIEAWCGDMWPRPLTPVEIGRLMRAVRARGDWCRPWTVDGGQAQMVRAVEVWTVALTGAFGEDDQQRQVRALALERAAIARPVSVWTVEDVRAGCAAVEDWVRTAA